MTRYIKSFQNAEAIQEAVNNEELLKPYVAYNESAATIDYNTKNVVDYRLEPLTFTEILLNLKAIIKDTVLALTNQQRVKCFVTVSLLLANLKCVVI